MRALALALLLALPFATTAAAQQAPAGQPEITAVQSPAPVVERRVDGYRVLAISAGALGGAMVGHALIGGTVPMVIGGGGGMAVLQGAGTGYMLLRGAVVAGSAVAGGYIGDWLYGE